MKYKLTKILPLSIILIMVISGGIVYGCDENIEQPIVMEESISTDEEKDNIVHKYESSSDFLNSVEGVLFQISMQKFAKAYFTDNKEVVKEYLIDTDEVRTYGKDVFDKLEYFILKWNLDNIKSEDRINASYQFMLEGEDCASYLTLEMKKVDEQWKVLFYGLEG